MIKTKLGVQGFYKAVVSKDKECKKVVKETGWMPNLITNAGMDYIGTSNLLYNNSGRRSFFVGSGNTPPAFTDTSLETQIAWAETGTGGTAANGTNGTYAYYQYTKQFSQGAAAGNIAEVGFGPTELDPLFSRALVVDSGGNPTTITVLSDEFLTLTYEVRVYIPQTDYTSTMDFIVDGVAVTTDITVRANGVLDDYYWGAENYGTVDGGAYDIARVDNLTMGGIEVVDQGGTQSLNNDSFSITADPYVSGSWERTATATVGINTGNYAEGINYFQWDKAVGVGSFKMNFTPALAKDNTKEIKFNVGCSWTRV